MSEPIYGRNRVAYGRGSWLLSNGFGGYVAGAALCSDGVVRSLRFGRYGIPDTFFSVPASVRVRGVRVSGFIVLRIGPELETVRDWSTATADDPAVVKFVANRWGRNASALPAGAFRLEEVSG